jgi:hypothetical protein
MDDKDFEQAGVHFVTEGDLLCCRFNDFVDLHTSPAGFGPTKQDAYEDLLENALK